MRVHLLAQSEDECGICGELFHRGDPLVSTGDGDVAHVGCVDETDHPLEQGEVTRSSVAPTGPVRTSGASPAEGAAA